MLSRAARDSDILDHVKQEFIVRRSAAAEN
jgi:hypothetical protein